MSSRAREQPDTASDALDRPDLSRPGAAFLLTQVGAHAARAFADRVATLELSPPQTGLLRAVATYPGESQQVLAGHLGTPPTRLVALVDALEGRSLLERTRNPADRRVHAVHLTARGRALLREVGDVARAHEDALLAALDHAERGRLRDLLARVAADQDLVPGVHPGYRSPAARPDEPGT